MLDMKEDSQIPIILVRPLLEIASAIIDVENGKLSLPVGKKIELDLSNKVKKSSAKDSCCRVDMLK